MKLLSLGLRAEKNFSEPETSKMTAVLTNLEDIAEIKEKLKQVCRKLTLARKEVEGFEGFLLKIDEVQKNNYIFLECHIREGELSFKNYELLKASLINSVSDIIASFIVDRQEKKLVRKVLKNDHIYLSASESEILTNNILTALNCTSSQNSQFNTGLRKTIIQEELLEYLNSHHELVLEGFICFRLKDYHQKLEQAIDSVVADFLVEQEYKEFLKVLKYFVDIQPPRVEKIHVIVKDDGTFKMPNADRELINLQYLDNIVTYYFNKNGIEFKPNPAEINYEDALISVLITIAPNNIMLHSNNLSRDKEIIEKIKSIFTGRVVTCDGCETCKFENSFENTANTIP